MTDAERERAAVVLYLRSLRDAFNDRKSERWHALDVAADEIETRHHLSMAIDRECICPRCGIRHGLKPESGDF